MKKQTFLMQQDHPPPPPTGPKGDETPDDESNG